MNRKQQESSMTSPPPISGSIPDYLRAAQARGRDHLHRLGDLLRRLDRADPASEVNQ